jgi:hypothetical protein
MKKKQDLLFRSIIFLILLCGCGSGGGDTPNDDPNKGNDAVDMTGLWLGKTATQNNGEIDTSFQLAQDRSNISGSLTFGNATTHNVTGFIHDSKISVSGIFQTRQGVELEFAYEGIISGGDFTGTFTMFDMDDNSTQDKGTFSLSKNENAPDPNPGPSPSAQLEVDVPSCFKLSTAIAQSGYCSNEDDGSLEFIEGSKVDLYANNDNYCVKQGLYADLESVPNDYSNCDWTFAVEGGSGLENTGIIVRDASATHHYKMRIVENDLPAITFEYEQID